VNHVEMTHRGNGDGSPDELDSVGTPPPRLQNQHSASSSPLSSLGATPSLESYVPETRPLGVYNDMVPANKPFWVEINPKGDSFNRDDFIMNEEEFRIVGIFGDIGEGDDISYECQFEDDHTAIVYSRPGNTDTNF